MCCRYRILPAGADDDRIAAVMAMMEKKYPGQYKTGEIFPGDPAPAVFADRGRVQPVPAVFGFPGFQANRLILNARSETAAQKPTFALPLREQRIILPADGFFEWSHDGKKTKYFFTLNEPGTVYFCGLYRIVDGRFRFVILTRPADESMAGVHDRMPVIIGADSVRSYLTDAAAATQLLAAPAPQLRHEPA